MVFPPQKKQKPPETPMAITHGWLPSSPYQHLLSLCWVPQDIWTAGWVEPGVDGDHHWVGLAAITQGRSPSST